MEHMQVVELQEADGVYRFWSRPMPASEVSAYIARNEANGWALSDIDCAMTCPHIMAIRYDVDGGYFECSHGHARCSRHLPTVTP